MTSYSFRHIQSPHWPCNEGEINIPICLPSQNESGWTAACCKLHNWNTNEADCYFVPRYLDLKWQCVYHKVNIRNQTKIFLFHSFTLGLILYLLIYSSVTVCPEPNKSCTKKKFQVLPIAVRCRRVQKYMTCV